MSSDGFSFDVAPRENGPFDLPDPATRPLPASAPEITATLWLHLSEHGVVGIHRVAVASAALAQQYVEHEKLERAALRMVATNLRTRELPDAWPATDSLEATWSHSDAAVTITFTRRTA